VTLAKKREKKPGRHIGAHNTHAKICAWKEEKSMKKLVDSNI
jgi:hypothetical protein